MAKAKRKTRRVTAQPIIDATPERIAKDASEFVNPAKIDSSEQAIGYVRRFKSSRLDRLHANGKLSYRHYLAGSWYQQQHARCMFEGAVIASYGERTSAGEPAYGIARTQAQADARKLFREARNQLPFAMLGFVDRFLLHDDLPPLRFGGRNYMRTIGELATALDGLADWLKLPEGR